LQIVKFLITFGIVVSINSNLHWLFVVTSTLHLHPASLLPLVRTLARIRLLTCDCAPHTTAPAPHLATLFTDAHGRAVPSRFRTLFAVYLLAPIALLFLNYAVLTWRVTWLEKTTQEMLALGVYVAVAALLVLNRELFYTAAVAAAAAAATVGNTAPAPAPAPVPPPAPAPTMPTAAQPPPPAAEPPAGPPPDSEETLQQRRRRRWASGPALPLGRHAQVVAEASGPFIGP
jgi:hypothetical protein